MGAVCRGDRPGGRRGKLRLLLCAERRYRLREANPWLLWLLPLGGVAIVLLYRICGMEKDRGTNFVLVAVRENQPCACARRPSSSPARCSPILLGGSSGREGAILQIGGSLSSKIGRWMHLDDKDSRIITMCGMSAAFSALFGTPLTAAMFAMEVTSVGVLYYAAIVPCVLSAIIGCGWPSSAACPPTASSSRGCPTLPPSPFSSASAWGSSSPCFPSCSAG